MIGGKVKLKTFKPYSGHISIFIERCCDECNEIMHNHLDCPVCGQKYADSENYGDISEDMPRRLYCECGAVFETTEDPYDTKSVWRQVEEVR